MLCRKHYEQWSRKKAFQVPHKNFLDNFIDTAFKRSIPRTLLFGSEFIGQGTFGKIYKSTFAGFDVAVKEVQTCKTSCPRMLFQQIEQLSYELDSLQQCNHPNIVELVGTLVDFPDCQNDCEPLIGIILELCPYGSLHHILFETSQYLPIHRKVLIGSGVASGLAHIHALSILHRDLNSANVLLAHEYVPKIADFGCSVRPPFITLDLFTQPPREGRPNRSAYTTTAPTQPSVNYPFFPTNLPRSSVCTQRRLSAADGAVSGADRVGTPAYMSPEQMRGEALTAASDVWALALLLWELAAEAKPWADGGGGGPGVAEMLLRVAAAGAEVRLPEEWGYPAGYAEAVRAGTRFQVTRCGRVRRPFLREEVSSSR